MHAYASVINLGISSGSLERHTDLVESGELSVTLTVVCVGYMLRFEYQDACLHISAKPQNNPESHTYVPRLRLWRVTLAFFVRSV